MSKINKFIILISLFLLLMVIPSAFAADDDSSLQANDTATVEVEALSPDSDILQAGNNIYFDASAAKDGDGSINKPYKYLYSNRITRNANIHLANGEYYLDRIVSVNGVTITGDDAEKTIINYDGCAFNVENNKNFKLTSVTLNGITIVNNGKLSAQNTIFANGRGYIEDDYYNTFGGAIYTHYEYDYDGPIGGHTLTLTSCKFINNTAEYGGAIFIGAGSLTVDDTLFENNVAYNYGGAIAAEYNIRTIISNSRFKNDRSTNDAGGAIYLRESPMTGTNLNFTDCYATFGGGITSLNSALTLKSIYGKNNTAKYDGGVIFHMYEPFSLTESELMNNHAHNGGALFIDNSTSFTLTTTSFTNNTAKYCAGAVYSLLNNLKNGNSVKDSANKNTFLNNTALFRDDEYEVSTVEMRIGDGNYRMFKVNETEITEIPEYYSLIEHNLVTPVKDQESSGNCWAFTAIATLESCILKASGDCYDLSEENLKNLIELYSDYGWDMDTNEGGYDGMSIGYLVSWLGPVNETDDETDDRSTLSPVLNSIMHVQNVAFLKRDSYTDNNAIKEAILKYGAVATGIYYDDLYMKGSSYYFYDSADYSNHGVTIVGWDDNYSRNKFYRLPKGNGAWIVKNSWNTDWGNDGYFYVSYYDTSFAKIGESDVSFTFILNDTIKFDKNYQYDIPGKTDYFLNSSSEVWYKNVFKSTDNELLAAVSTYFEKLTDWEVLVYVNNVLKTSKTGTSKPGYYTINLDDLIPLRLGDVFEVVFHISVDGEAGFPISEKASLNKKIYDENISFVSYNGINWKDLYDLEWEYSDHIYNSQVACIKAFTILKGIETITSVNVTYDGFNPVNITATVTDENGVLVTTGNVTFTIDGKDYIVDVVEGIATLIHEFDKKQNDVLLVYNGLGYKSSTNSTSISIEVMNVDLSLEIFKNLNSAVINVSTLQKINTTVLALVNTEKYNITLVNGKGSLKLEEVDKGKYTVNVSITNTEIYNSTGKNDSFTIDVITTKIRSSNLFTDEYSNENYTIILTNKSGDVLPYMDVKFVLNGKTINATTDENGSASIPINLSSDKYEIRIIFEGEGEYLKSEVKNLIRVKERVNITLTINQHINNVIINIEASQPINETVYVKVNDDEYLVNLTDGKNTLALKALDNNNYTIVSVLVNNTDYFSNITTANFTINISKLNIISSDFNTTDYSGELYRVILKDEDNNPVAGKILFFDLNGETYNSTTDENGTASIPVSLDGGNYRIITYFNGDNEFFNASNENNITVKQKIEISISISQNVQNIVITLRLSKDIEESLNVTVNGKPHTVKPSNGKGTLTLRNLENGDYNITAGLLNQDRYVADQVSSNITINITQATIIAYDMNTTDYSNEIYSITFLDINNKPIANKKIRFLLDGVTYIRTTDNEGCASIPIYIDVGTHYITVSFAADNDYYQTSAICIITVDESVKSKIILTKTQKTVNIEIELSKPITDNVTVSVNGENYTVGIFNGKGILTIENNAEDYDVKVSSDKFVITPITSLPDNEKIISDDFTTYYRSGSEYRITLLNNNMTESGKMITFTLNGEIYRVMTDRDGIASVKISLDVGTYGVTIICGDIVKSQKITVISPITENKDLAKYYKGSEVYKIRILGDNGKAVGSGELVTMQIAGKTYKVYTDKNGYASLNVNLKPNTYLITATYKGYMVSNKITIKSTIITKNISKKKSKTVKFTAKLVNTYGKALKKKKITFKLKGKTYKVKTNKKGIATLKLKNLKVGKHIVYSSYGGLTVKNTIKIK